MVAVTTLSTLCATKPTSDGIPIGVDDWRLVVERIGAAVEGDHSLARQWGDGTQWGTVDARGTPKWGALAWEDLTGVWRGMEWTRGALAPKARPAIGEISLTLTNPSSGEMDPWQSYGRARPGRLCRAGLVSDTDERAGGWLPLWTGVVMSWTPTYVARLPSGHRADSQVDVTLAETLSTLATLDRNALGSPVGAGELFDTRINRLLTDAVWPYGLVTAFSMGAPNTTLQSTDMSLNRLAELYLTADSVAHSEPIVGPLIDVGVVRSDVTGAALVTTRAPQNVRIGEFSTGPVQLDPGVDDDDEDEWTIGYHPDGFESANDVDGLVNHHRYARAGGTQQTVRHDVSVGYFKTEIVRERNDLIGQTDGQVLTVAHRDNDREARAVLRAEAIPVSFVAAHRPIAALAVAALDVGDYVHVKPPGPGLFGGVAAGPIRSVTHSMRPLQGTVAWDASYAVDFDFFQSIPAPLDPAP